MGAFSIESIAGLLILVVALVFAAKSAFQLLFSGVKLAASVAVAFFIVQLTFPSVKPYLDRSTSMKIEGVMEGVRFYGKLLTDSVKEDSRAKLNQTAVRS